MVDSTEDKFCWVDWRVLKVLDAEVVSKKGTKLRVYAPVIVSVDLSSILSKEKGN